MNSPSQPAAPSNVPPQAEPVSIRVFIVEDDPRPRASLRALFEGTPGFACCGDCATGEAALKSVPATAPDVVLMDIGLPGMSGTQCTAALIQRAPAVRVLMLTQHDAPDRIFEALRAGASGYLLKYEALARLLEAIAEVHRGGGVMSPAVARLVMESFAGATPASPPMAPLSDRELEALRLMRDSGLSTTKELADRLGISPRTVETHLRNIYEKLHVHTRTAALAKFVGQGR